MPPAANARRNPSDEGNAEDAIFMKDGYPVFFFFHASIRQGLDVLKQEITKNGGEVCEDEQQANVILVDEEADIEHIRRRYYRSLLRWQQAIFIEPRGWLRRCITTKKYEHLRPPRQGMPGVRPGSRVGRVRVPFTGEDDSNLAYYIASVIPYSADGGRMGNSLYRTLTEELALEPEYTWAKRHTWHSWRERYKTHTQYFEPKIAEYVAELKDVSHGFGHDPRSHRYRRGRLVRGAQRMEEEEEEEEEEDSDREAEQREVGGAGPEDNQVPGGVPQVHEEAEGAQDIPDDGTGPAEQQLRRRRRDDPDTSQREILSGESPHKRQRVADRAVSRFRASPVEKGRRESGHGRPSRNLSENNRRSPEEGIDGAFAQRPLDGTISFGNDQMPELYEPPVQPPEHEVPEAQPDEPLATQQTLVNSPAKLRPQPVVRARLTAEVVQAAPMSSQATVVAPPLRAARRPLSRRERDEREESPTSGAPTPAAATESTQQAKPTRPSSRSLGHQSAVALSDAPYRHTRARSQSVDLPPQSAPPSRARRVVSAKGKSREKELEEVPEEDAKRNVDESGDSPIQISEKVVERKSQPASGSRPELSRNIRESAQNEGRSTERGEGSSRRAQVLSRLPDTLQEEEDVENILGRSLFTDDEYEASDKSSNRGRQEFSVNSSSEEPSDSDDAATHRMLQQAPVKEESSSEESESDELQQHNGQRLTRMATAGFGLRGRSRLPKTPVPASKKLATKTTGSPAIRVTRQRVQARPFPSPGTKARTVYETRLQERRGK